MEITFFWIMLGVGGFIGLVTLVYVIRSAFDRSGSEIGGWVVRGSWGRIRAVARTTVAEGLRVKVASGFALMIVAAIPLFWLTADGDGTIKGRVQMFVSYSLGFASLLLAILTALFSCRSLSVEIGTRQIYSIASKPVPRWQILAGKWAGIMGLNVILVAVAGGATYAGTVATLARFKRHLAADLQTYGGLTSDLAGRAVAALDDVRGIGAAGMESPVIEALARALGQTHEQVGDMLVRLPEPTRVDLRRFDELRRQVLVARAGVAAELPDFSQDAEEFVRRMAQEGETPEGMTRRELVEFVRKRMELEFCNVAPMTGRRWILQGPPPERSPRFLLSVGFKIQVPGEVPAAEHDGQTLELNTLVCLWGVGDPASANYLQRIDAFPVNTFTEAEIPIESVAADGKVLLSFENRDPRNVSASFDLEHRDLQLLYRVGSFELNLFQACAAVLIPLGCLAAFGVCASTFLTFPVGALIVLSLYLIGSSMGFMAESLAATPEYVGPNPDLSYRIREKTVQVMDWLLAVSDLDPIRNLIEGRAVTWSALGRDLWRFGLLRGGPAMLVAVLVFRRRELAQVIV